MLTSIPSVCGVCVCTQEVWGQGCVTLVGDAAHGLLPTLGQGAGQGIEDAVELAVVSSEGACAAGGPRQLLAARAAGHPRL